MAPDAHNPFSPHRPARTTDRRPWRSREPGVCLICQEATERGEPLDLPAHTPDAHIGGPDAGVVLSRGVTPDEGGLSEWDGSHLRSWWEANVPEDVEVVAFYGDEKAAPATLPDEVAAGFLSAGSTGHEVLLLAERWAAGTDEDRAGALDLVAAFTPDDWTEAAKAWADVVASGVLEDDDDTADVPWPLLNGHRPSDEEAKGNDLAAQQAEVDAWAAGHEDPAAAFAELTAWDEAVRAASTEVTPDEDPGTLFDGDAIPIPAGHQRVTVAGPDGDHQKVTGDVPEDHEAALAFLEQREGEDPDGPVVATRARLVLAAELTRPASRRRKSVLAKVTEVLGDDEVAATIAGSDED